MTLCDEPVSGGAEGENPDGGLLLTNICLHPFSLSSWAQKFCFISINFGKKWWQKFAKKIFINDDDKYCENGDIADKDKDDYDDDDEDKDKDDADEHKNAISDGGSTAL